MIDSHVLQGWIDALPDIFWKDWKNDFARLSPENKACFWGAVEDAGVTDYQSFLEYMERY